MAHVDIVFHHAELFTSQYGLLGARTLLGAPGIATRNKKLLGAPGRTTRSKTLLGTSANVLVCGRKGGDSGKTMQASALATGTVDIVLQ